MLPSNSFAQILLPAFYKDLKQATLVMTRQWSKAILQKWIIVYCVLVQKLLSDPEQLKEKLTKEFVDGAFAMSELSQPISVRVSSTTFAAQMAKQNSLLSTEAFLSHKVLSKVRQLCQDFNWEVRKEMCQNLVHVSEYLGPHQAQTEIFSEIEELLDDEEVEVKTQAIKSLVKHLQLVFDESFKTSERMVATVIRLLQSVTDDEGCPMTHKLHTLKRLSKIAQAIKNPDHEKLRTMYRKFFNNMRKEGNEDTRSYLALSIEGFAHVYNKDNLLLAEIYNPLFGDFIREELKNSDPDVLKHLGRHIHHLVLASFTNRGDTDTKLQIMQNYLKLM